jgi:hypothetical protein
MVIPTSCAPLLIEWAFVPPAVSDDVSVYMGKDVMQDNLHGK